ncbi:MAG: hypothetical protein WC969_00375 [Elusimicrobiota bacterium]|jgi:hypothetical protein
MDMKPSRLALVAAFVLASSTQALNALEKPLSKPIEGVRDSGRRHCDPGSLKNRPPIVLVGEDHDSISAWQVKKEMIDRAAKGELYAALEGYTPWQAWMISEQFKTPFGKDARVFGVDSPIMYGLAGCHQHALDDFARFRRSADANDAYAPAKLCLHFLFLLQDNPFVRHAWEIVRDREDGFVGTELEPLARVFDQAMNARPDALGKLLGDFTPEDESRFIRLVRKIDAAFVAWVNEAYASDLGIEGPLYAVPEDWPSMRAFWDYAKFRFDSDTPIVRIRNRDMFDNIADVYCAAAEEGRALVVSVGQDHVQGLGERLQAWSQGRIDLRVGNSSSDGDAISRELERLSPRPKKKLPTIPFALSEDFSFAAAEKAAPAR